MAVVIIPYVENQTEFVGRLQAAVHKVGGPPAELCHNGRVLQVSELADIVALVKAEQAEPPLLAIAIDDSGTVGAPDVLGFEAPWSIRSPTPTYEPGSWQATYVPSVDMGRVESPTDGETE